MRSIAVFAIVAVAHSGCLFVYSVDDGGGSGGGIAGGGAGGVAAGGHGGAPGTLTSIDLSEPGQAVSFASGRGIVLSGDESDQVWAFTSDAPPVAIGTIDPAFAAAVAVHSDGSALIAKRDVTAGAPALAACDVGGCMDASFSSLDGVELSGVARVGDDIAVVRRSDGVMEVRSAIGTLVDTLGIPAAGGGGAVARETEVGDIAVAWWAIGSARDGIVWRALWSQAEASFGPAENVSAGGPLEAIAIAPDGSVYFAQASGSTAIYQRWEAGSAVATNLGLSGPRPASIAVGSQDLFIVGTFDALVSVGRCPLSPQGGPACIAADISCGRVGGIAADGALDVAYFTCDQALVIWPPP